MAQDQPKELIPQPFFSRQPPTAEDFKRVEEFRQRAFVELAKANDGSDLKGWLSSSLLAAEIEIERIDFRHNQTSSAVFAKARIVKSEIQDIEGKVAFISYGGDKAQLPENVRHIIVSEHEPPYAMIPYALLNPAGKLDKVDKWRQHVAWGAVLLTDGTYRMMSVYNYEKLPVDQP